MPQTPPDPDPPRDGALVDFARFPRRLQAVAGVVGGLALVGCVVEGVLRGLTFELMGRWAGLFVLGMVLGTAVLTALHALGGADRAGRRGERLSSPDVGLAPRKLDRRRGAAGPSDGAAGGSGLPDDPEDR